MLRNQTSDAAAPSDTRVRIVVCGGTGCAPEALAAKLAQSLGTAGDGCNFRVDAVRHGNHELLDLSNMASRSDGALLMINAADGLDTVGAAPCHRLSNVWRQAIHCRRRRV